MFGSASEAKARGDAARAGGGHADPRAGGRDTKGRSAGSRDWRNPTPGRSLNRKPPNMRSTPNPTIGVPLTGSNAMKLGGTIASTLAGPAGMAVSGATTAIDSALNGTFDPLSPFDGPFTKELGFDYDPSNRFGTQSSMSGKTSATKRITSKPKKPGFSLLSGAGGTLLGS
jgi:hypothetical protein